MFAIIWGVSFITAAVAGIFLANVMVINLGLSFVAVSAFPAIILGGLESIPGAIIGGLAIGVIENLAGGYLDQVIGGGVKDVTPFVVLFLILMIKPYGLFGKKEIERDYYFLSDLLKNKCYEEFFRKIYVECDLFREIFNAVIDEYGTEFRFRYKNFPFPKLQEDELPFWIVHKNKRFRCFRKDIETSDISKLTIFPRAAALTIFLRLYRLDVFIHGIGGGNYEWVQNRMIERFFKKTPPSYTIISGTFLLENHKERDLSYFFFPPETIRESVYSYLGKLKSES